MRSVLRTYLVDLILNQYPLQQAVLFALPGTEEVASRGSVFPHRSHLGTAHGLWCLQIIRAEKSPSLATTSIGTPTSHVPRGRYGELRFGDAAPVRDGPGRDEPVLDQVTRPLHFAPSPTLHRRPLHYWPAGNSGPRPRPGSPLRSAPASGESNGKAIQELFSFTALH